MLKGTVLFFGIVLFTFLTVDLMQVDSVAEQTCGAATAGRIIYLESEGEQTE